MNERRAFPRYPIVFPVALSVAGPEKTTVFCTECVNVSRSSIEISCDSKVIQALLAQDDYPHNASLKFAIPGDRSSFNIKGQVVTHRRLAQNHYYLVLVFNEFEEGSDEQLVMDLRDFEPGGFRVDSAR